VPSSSVVILNNFISTLFWDMLEENIWMQLSESEKLLELQTYLDTIIAIDEGKHVLSNTREQGKLPDIKKEFHDKIYKIIELENTL